MENIALNFLTDQQAREIIRQELTKFFFENPILPKQEKPENKVVDLDGLLIARPFIGSRSTLYKKIAKGLIPHSKQGKKLFFDLQLIDQWLLENKVKTSFERRKEIKSRRGKPNRK